MVTGFVVIGWKLALTFVATSAGVTTLGVYLLARFAHVFDAYGGERAKLLAQFHSLDKLVEQTQKLTATTEAIKAQISDYMWDRQWRQGQKLKIYSQILQAINEYSICLSDVSEGRKFGSASSPLTTIKKDSAQIAEDFHAAYVVAPLFLSKDSLDLLETAKPAFSYHSSPFSDDDMKDADKTWDMLRGVRRDLSSSAKLDFALSGPPNEL
jgi:type IV secretory pathway VirB4 component